MTGSADIFEHHGRTPRASINHVTVHDGFTLADLVSYERKHNEANRENNRDGSDSNLSTNCGVEGPTDDAEIVAMRRRLRRNFLSCLLLAQGVPLLLAGDEVGNSQGGNNNAYCQDNEIGWVDWSGLGRDGEDMTAFIGQLAQLRRALPAASGSPAGSRVDAPDGTYDVLWLTPDAGEMIEAGLAVFRTDASCLMCWRPSKRAASRSLSCSTRLQSRSSSRCRRSPSAARWTRVLEYRRQR